MSEAAKFSEDLAFGLEWENQATERLETLLLSVRATNIDYSKRPELQRAGIDSILTQDQPTFDVKCQRHKYASSSNLPIETQSVAEKGKLGWFYTSDADMIVWIFPNKVGTNLHKTGYLMPLHDGLREWVKDEFESFRRFEKKNTGEFGDYTTEGLLIPIDKFPTEYLVEFDPRLPTDRETPQSDIMTWAKS